MKLSFLLLKLAKIKFSVDFSVKLESYLGKVREDDGTCAGLTVFMLSLRSTGTVAQVEA